MAHHIIAYHLNYSRHKTKLFMKVIKMLIFPEPWPSFLHLRHDHKRFLVGAVENFIENDVGSPTTGNEVTLVDQTNWKGIVHLATKGRRAIQNVLRKSQGPTSYAKRKINSDNVISARRLMFSYKMVRLLKQSTKTITTHQLRNDTLTVTLDELDAVFCIMYSKEDYMGQNIFQ